jgi:hypothetical protein
LTGFPVRFRSLPDWDAWHCKLPSEKRTFGKKVPKYGKFLNLPCHGPPKGHAVLPLEKEQDFMITKSFSCSQDDGGLLMGES